MLEQTKTESSRCCKSKWIGLEQGRGEWNSWRRGEIHRYQEEYRRRRHLSSHLADAEVRKRGYQRGLETLVVHALNDENSSSG